MLNFAQRTTRTFWRQPNNYDVAESRLLDCYVYLGARKKLCQRWSKERARQSCSASAENLLSVLASVSYNSETPYWTLGCEHRSCDWGQQNVPK